MCFIWTISQTHTGGKIAARNRRDEGEGGYNGVKAGVDYALHPLPIPRRLNPSPLSEFCPYGLELPTRGVYVEWWSFEEASIVETNLGSFSYKKRNLVSNFLMSY